MMNTGRLTRTVSAGVIAIGTYAALLAVSRPWHRRWGAIDDEIAQSLPGDELSDGAALANHAITIDAPIEEVWPWLVQIGQDRAGFYSYSWLENLFRAGIHNADEIVPEWQTIEEGGFVRLASKDVYGDGPLLRVSHVRPGRSFVLEGWGEFVLRPVDKHTTRLLIRTHRSKQSPLVKALSVFIFDPAHFVMERRMLLGIKERAERNRHRHHVRAA
jgi:hypothetical protein